jgi:predicted RND superfamily exporter protein
MQSPEQEPEDKDTMALEPAPQSNFSPVTRSVQKGQWIVSQVSTFLVQSPNYLASLFNKYNQLIISIALFLTAIIAVKIVLAVMNALDDIPLVSLTLELVGVGYSVWFVNRYLLKDSTRQELFQDIDTFLNKQQ